MTHEEQYIEETGNKKPEATYVETYVLLVNWYKRYSLWLSQRLERVEKEKEIIWTMGKVAMLNKRQSDHKQHPYTCGKRSDHPIVNGDKGILIATIYGWICPYCDYKQCWAHEL